MPLHLPLVGVIGSGTNAHAEWSEPLGAMLASEGVHLVTGGGGGVMEAVSRSFASARPQRLGRVIGVLPGSVEESGHQAPPGYPNPWVEIPIHTHLPLRGITGTSALSRSHLIVLSCAALIALPGGHGTRSEIDLAFEHGRPVLGFSPGPGDEPGAESMLQIPWTNDLNAVRVFLRRAIQGR